MNGCQTCGGFGNRHDPIAHGAWGDEEFTAEDLCHCGHEHLRHDMGHGCIECRCRRFQDDANRPITTPAAPPATEPQERPPCS